MPGASQSHPTQQNNIPKDGQDWRLNVTMVILWRISFWDKKYTLHLHYMVLVTSRYLTNPVFSTCSWVNNSICQSQAHMCLLTCNPSRLYFKTLFPLLVWCTCAFSKDARFWRTVLDFLCDHKLLLFSYKGMFLAIENIFLPNTEYKHRRSKDLSTQGRQTRLAKSKSPPLCWGRAAEVLNTAV